MLKWLLNKPKYLKEIKVADGVAQSGNLAMCAASILYFLAEFSRNDEAKQALKYWVHYHLNSMNKYGFWGRKLGFLSSGVAKCFCLAISMY